MAVELLTESTPEIIEAMERPIPQLSRSAKPPDAQACERFISQPGAHFLAYHPDTADTRGEHPVLSMFSFAVLEIPTNVQTWTEDVVVDGVARGQGTDLKLAEAALEQTEEVGARTVDLTGRPSRETANRLCRRAGFEQREASVYRVPLD